MSRHVVPAIVFVTLTIMFGSSFLAQRYGAKPRPNASEATQLAGRSDVSGTTAANASRSNPKRHSNPLEGSGTNTR